MRVFGEIPLGNHLFQDPALQYYGCTELNSALAFPLHCPVAIEAAIGVADLA